jgi:hypothetical protein
MGRFPLFTQYPEDGSDEVGAVPQRDRRRWIQGYRQADPGVVVSSVTVESLEVTLHRSLVVSVEEGRVRWLRYAIGRPAVDKLAADQADEARHSSRAGRLPGPQRGDVVDLARWTSGAPRFGQPPRFDLTRVPIMQPPAHRLGQHHRGDPGGDRG